MSDKLHLSRPAAPFSKPLLVVLSIGFALPTSVALAQTLELPASWSYASEANDSAAPRFAGRIAQARGNAGLTATIARGNAHLDGNLIEPDTGEVYVNLATTDANKPAGWGGMQTVGADGAFIVDGVVNFSNDGSGFPLDDGNFGEAAGNGVDQRFPGILGGDDDSLQSFANGQNFPMVLTGYLALPAGEVVLCYPTRRCGGSGAASKRCA